jgi:hypothetical protein
MGEIIGLTLVIIAISITLIAFLTLMPFLIPQRTERVRAIIHTMPGRSFIVGLVNFIFFFVVAAIFAQGGGEIGRLLGGVILLVLTALAAIGLGGMLLIVRQRIYPDDKAEVGVNVTARTAVLLVLAALTPIIGWFVLTPILLLISLGAAIITFVRRELTPHQEPDLNP